MIRPSVGGQVVGLFIFKGVAMELSIDKIKMDAGTQPRACLNNDVINEYASAMTAGEQFPPVVVFYDGKVYYLADGFHRVNAAIACTKTKIESDVKQGTRRDAILYSVGVNATHGLRRTNEDKRRAVMLLLEDKEWSSWSDYEIAKRVNVSHTFVAGLRSVTSNVSSEKTYTDKHGTTTTMNTANIGKSKPEPLENESPNIFEQEEDTGEAQECEADEEDETESNSQEKVETAVSHTESYIEIRLIALDDDISRGEYVHSMMKFLKEKGIEYTRNV
jgi:hypothetical protein